MEFVLTPIARESRPVRIVHVTFEHPNASWGGIGTAVELMTKAARTLSFPTAIVSPAPSNVPQAGDGVEDIRLHIPGIDTPANVYQSSNRVALGELVAKACVEVLSRMDLSQSIVIVHHEELSPLFGCDLLGNRLVYFSHGLSEQEHPSDRTLISLQRELARSQVPICVATRYQAQLLSATWGSEPSVVRLPLSLYLDEEIPNVSRQQHVVAAGRFVPQKGFDLLIRALALVPSEIRCTIVGGHGDVDYENRCRRIATELGVHVHWSRWKDRSILREVVASSSLMVVPSRFEPLGLVAAEALAVGTPVAGFDVGGLGELLREAGEEPMPNVPEPEKIALLADRIDVSTSERQSVNAKALRTYTPSKFVSDLTLALAERTG